MKIGYLAFSKASWLTPAITAITEKTFDGVAGLPGVTVVGSARPAITETDAVAAAGAFCREGVDVAIFHFVTFPAGALIPAAARQLTCPILLLANPEKPGPGGVWTQNSFCGANLAAFVMNRLGKPYRYVRALAADTPAALAAPLAAARAIAGLKTLRIGLLGGRVPGFYTSNFDEMRYRKEFGVTVETLALLELTDHAQKLAPATLAAARDTVKHAAAQTIALADGDVERAAQLLGAFRDMAQKYRLDSFAVRCWPEFSDIFGIAPCAILGMLSDDGTPASCEGDVPGAVTMAILRMLAGGGVPIFVDLIDYDENDDTGVIWHCGAAPKSLARQFSETALRLHMRVDGGDRKGVTNEFPMKAGRITVAKLDQDAEGKFRMLIAPGEALDTEPFLRGNPLRIRFDGAVKTLIDTIVTRGFEHHYAAIHADVTAELLDFCRLMNIEPVVVK